jgi:hypothetical protein
MSNGIELRKPAKMNYTITVPDGSSNHGTPNLLCVPPTWFDYIIFFVSNYLVHAATIVTPPGATLVEVCFISANALFIPSSGALSAVRLLLKHAAWSRATNVCRAAKAGALCMVIKREYLTLFQLKSPSDVPGAIW